MTRFCDIDFSNPEMWPMYLITETYNSDGKIKWDGILYHFYIKLRNRNYFDCF